MPLTNIFYSSCFQGNVFETELDERNAIFDTVCRPWNDWSNSAKWLESLWSSDSSWVEAHGGKLRIHGIFNLLGASFYTLVADSLHIMDLGVSHRVLGNVFFHIVWEGDYFTSATAEERLGEFWRLIQLENLGSGAKSQLGTLTLNMFSNPTGRNAHQPDLSTRVKAAETRHLVPVVLSVFSRLKRRLNPQDTLIFNILHCLPLYYSILSEHKDVVSLPLAAQRELERALWSINRNYSALGAWAAERRLLRWGVTIKFHMALHIALQSRYTNPALTWTYIDEDFMSIVKTVGEACTKGIATHQVVPKMCRRYLTGMDVRMSYAIDLDAMD